MSGGFFNKDIFGNEIKEKPKNQCDKCGLYKKCINPKIQYSGKGNKKILLIFDNPSKIDDEYNTVLRHETGKLLKSLFRKYNINIVKDCWVHYAVRCYNPKKSTVAQINYCRNNIQTTIKELQPKKIFVFGKEALQGLIGHKTSVTIIDSWVGWNIPDQEFKAWIYPNYDLSFLKQKEHIVKFFEDNLKNAIDHISFFPDYSNIQDRIICTKDTQKIKSFISNIQDGDIITFDYETTGLKPEAKGHKIICMSICKKGQSISFPIINEIVDDIRFLLSDKTIKKIAQNLRFEHIWTDRIFKTTVKNWYWDTCIASHIIDNRKGVTGLKFQTYINFGIIGYDDSIKSFIDSEGKSGNNFNNIKKAKMDDLLLYCGLDSLFTYLIYKRQQQILNKDNYLKKGFDFFMQGQIHLTDIQTNGIRFDRNLYEKNNKKMQIETDNLHTKIMQSVEVKKWDLETEFNYNSTKDLNYLLFDKLQLKSVKKTKTGKDSVDAEALQLINIPLTCNILKHRYYKKIKDTFLTQFERESVFYNNDWFIYPNFNLNKVVSYRSSSDSPNFQNIPSRDKLAKKTIRECLKARKGNQILEVDGKGMEVSTSCCYHHDPVMIDYVTNNGDMHGDLANKLFFRNDDWTRDERFCAKNGATFPMFYGSTARLFTHDHKIYGVGDITQNIWTMIQQSTKEHLKENGIKNIKDFQKHVEEIENWFWNIRFKVYQQWKYDNWAFYKKNGFVELKTGFRCGGILGYNDANNYPIQGTAFHILLQSLIILNNFIKKEKLNSRIIGQIHDSLVLDLDPQERDDLLPIIKNITTKEVKKIFTWINIPLSIEAEITGIDEGWNMKKEINI